MKVPKSDRGSVRSALASAAMASALAGLLAACAALPRTPVPPAPPGGPASVVVVDIDGTLTPADPLFLIARPHAARVLRAYAQHGYVIVYETAREPVAQAGLSEWLAANGFPAGPLHVASSVAERRHPDRFKADLLRCYAARGWHLAYAYGNAKTDFNAYAQAGLSADRVFSLARVGVSACEPGAPQCLRGWAAHLALARDAPPAAAAPNRATTAPDPAAGCAAE